MFEHIFNASSGEIVLISLTASWTSVYDDLITILIYKLVKIYQINEENQNYKNK